MLRVRYNRWFLTRGAELWRIQAHLSRPPDWIMFYALTQKAGIAWPFGSGAMQLMSTSCCVCTASHVMGVTLTTWLSVLVIDIGWLSQLWQAEICLIYLLILYLYILVHTW